MDALISFILEMFVLYGMAILGFMTKKMKLFQKDSDHVLTKLILYITLPALILYSLNVHFSVDLLKSFVWLIIMSIYILFFTCLLAYRMRKKAKLSSERKNVYEGLIIFGNQGFIGFAVSYILLGEQGIIYATIFNVCYLVLIWTYGIYLFSRSKESIDWKQILWNPGIISTMIGIVIFFLPIKWPYFIAQGLESVGKMTIPLSMMTIGMLIANIKWTYFISIIRNKYLWKLALTRLILIPLLLLPFSLFPIGFSVLLVAVIVSGMPSAPTIALYAQRFGGDATFAAVGSFLTTLLCIITIPILYGFIYLIYF